MRLRVALAILLLTVPFAAEARNAAELQVAVRKLTVVGSALYVAAHPDDENTALLAWLSNDRLYRTGYLSVTRGDGGQNLIGDEKGPLLGVIRTQELLAARRIDRAEQMFTRAIDFGYSKNPEETFAIWNHERVLADVVWAIRKMQPDVIITRFPTTGEGGHGHHTASAILAVEAFEAAADGSKFPEQLRYVSPWQAKRLFWNRFSFRPVDPNDPAFAAALKLDLGSYNPLLGRAYTEIAAESRSQHKSQGFGSAERRGTLLGYFTPLKGAAATTDPFEGIDTTWARIPGGEPIGKLLTQTADGFDVKNPAKSIPALLQSLDMLERLGASDATRGNPWIDLKKNEIQAVILECAGIAIDVSATESSVVPGQPLNLSVSVVNRSDYPFILSTVASLYANPGKAPGAALKNNQPVKTDITIQLPADYEITRPYWLRETPEKGMYKVADAELVGRPENAAPVTITIALDDNQMHTLVYTVPVVYRWTDPVKGEQVRNVDVMPPAVAALDNHVYVFPDTKGKSVSVKVQSFANDVKGAVKLVAPAGWKVTPESSPIALAKKGDETDATFTVTPPSGDSTAELRAEVTLADGQTSSFALTSLDYPHIPAQRVLSPATAKVVRADIKRKGSRIGYIAGSGDEVPAALRQVGYQVVVLSDSDLDRADLAKYDAIVAGVRAYNTRKRLRGVQAKLLDYVKNGGTYVVQYNTTDDLVIDPIGPYPFKISRDRVTVEEAPMKIVHADSSLLTTPNRIEPKDFEGWVQERGLNFATEWDPKYSTVFSSADPGEKASEGSELYTRYGKGVFIYTTLSFFRELPAGVPGAYRLFVNLVSAK
jgi:LmbE family N-acetylglucosaminyl deacetylase